MRKDASNLITLLLAVVILIAGIGLPNLIYPELDPFMERVAQLDASTAGDVYIFQEAFSIYPWNNEQREPRPISLAERQMLEMNLIPDYLLGLLEYRGMPVVGHRTEMVERLLDSFGYLETSREDEAPCYLIYACDVDLDGVDDVRCAVGLNGQIFDLMILNNRWSKSDISLELDPDGALRPVPSNLPDDDGPDEGQPPVDGSPDGAVPPGQNGSTSGIEGSPDGGLASGAADGPDDAATSDSPDGAAGPDGQSVLPEGQVGEGTASPGGAASPDGTATPDGQPEQGQPEQGLPTGGEGGDQPPAGTTPPVIMPSLDPLPLETQAIWALIYTVVTEASEVNQEYLVQSFRLIDLNYQARYGYAFEDWLADQQGLDHTPGNSTYGPRYRLEPQLGYYTYRSQNYTCSIYDLESGVRVILHIVPETGDCMGFTIQEPN